MANETDDRPIAINNGLSNEDEKVLNDALFDLADVALRIGRLSPHRSHSAAITKIDEARHWILDRWGRAS